MTHALFKQIDLTAKLGQDGSSLQAMNALRVIRETVAKHLAGTEGAGEIPLERALLALRTIAELPCPEQDDLPAANMRQIALAALSGAGASAEPGNPGRESVSGPGNAGERPYPAPGLVGDHTELRRIAIALKNPLLSGEEASDLMVRYEALTMPDHIIALIDRQAQHSVPEEFIGRLSEFLAQRGATGKALLRELRAMLAAEPTSSASPSCKWTESSGIWETGCGQTWGFVEDGPAENGALFCHHCGGRLVLIKSDDQEDDGEPCPDCMENAPAPGCEA
ncbi:TPA: hypothetical protein ACKPX9_004435 [Pseudomonas aeruginosa]|uniref:hypothetical protein n=2 Tax=Pseudomonas aeruginosa TaxID=287 RepID=UPI000986FDF4|nr:hypothetical protein [Pseudomonas aeruginosa]MBH4313243.1 hypothetical protein [Pseudomonas aeruginosa]MBH8698482.1 hypothetical protein [Pseudomonas aeruginosa]MCC0358953.1 hypothetical protein [Pseudomonas aeruginosa]PXB79150.1 hypothetical protein C0045_04340 [Pseudomonas aeruginosa]TEQ52343.1 hypothetical protein IPC56_08390 [Pseudomonas aeruginosa]